MRDLFPPLFPPSSSSLSSKFAPCHELLITGSKNNEAIICHKVEFFLKERRRKGRPWRLACFPLAMDDDDDLQIMTQPALETDDDDTTTSIFLLASGGGEVDFLCSPTVPKRTRRYADSPDLPGRTPLSSFLTG